MFCEATITAFASAGNDCGGNDDHANSSNGNISVNSMTPHLPCFHLEGRDEEVAGAVCDRIRMLAADEDYTLSVQRYGSPETPITIG